MAEIKVNHIILPESIVFNFNHNTVTVHKGTPDYAKCLLAMTEGRMYDIPGILDKVTSLRAKFLDTGLTVINGVLYCDGNSVDTYLANKIITFFDQNLPFKPLVAYWRRLRKNPSPNSVSQLYRFAEVCKCAITEDGLIVTEKGVNATDDPNVFRSIWDSNFIYRMNEPARMSRDAVLDDPKNGCGPGLHAGSHSFAVNWAHSGNRGTVLELLIDPEHVVSVPDDHSFEKMRCCEVLPVAVREGGEYFGGIAIDSTKEERESVVVNSCSDSADPQTDNQVSALPILTIGDVQYKPYEITSKVYDNLRNAEGAEYQVPQVAGLSRYRASKSPAAIRKFCENMGMVVYESYKLFFSGVNVPLFVFKANGDLMDRCLLLHPLSVKPEAIVKVSTLAKVVTVDTPNPYLAKGMKVFGLVAYNGNQYEVVIMNNNVPIIAEFIENNYDGFVKSVIRLKPSRLPIGLLKILEPSNITDVKRIALLDDSVVFMMHYAGRTFIMRKE